MGPLKQLQQTTPGTAELNTKQPGALYNLAHDATITDLSGSGTLPQSELAMQSNVGTVPTEVDPNTGTTIPGAVPPDQMNPASPVAQKKGIIKKTIEKVKKNKADKKASKEAYNAAKSKGGGTFDMLNR